MSKEGKYVTDPDVQRAVRRIEYLEFVDCSVSIGLTLQQAQKLSDKAHYYATQCVEHDNPPGEVKTDSFQLSNKEVSSNNSKRKLKTQKYLEPKAKRRKVNHQ